VMALETVWSQAPHQLKTCTGGSFSAARVTDGSGWLGVDGVLRTVGVQEGCVLMVLGGTRLGWNSKEHPAQIRTWPFGWYH
jgi:hypothetical protein